MSKQESLLINRLKSIKFAFKGVIMLVKNETSIKIQACIAILITTLGFIVGLSTTEWALQLLAIGVVMGLESINTSIEKMADFIHPKFHEQIGQVKDIAAGAVFISSVIAGIIGLLIYIPKLL